MRRWPFVAVAIGLALQILAWVLVIPPYGTYDEFDHVYRASGVWHGQFAELRDAPAGYPQAVIADRALVEGGTSECLGLPYTSEVRCHPGPTSRDGTVIVTSGAARYNPLYYLAVSPATQIGSGPTTVLWMRAWSGMITVMVLAWTVFLFRSWPRPSQGVRGLMIAFTPMVAVSSAIVAPNGLEMAAGLLWWVSLLSLTRGQPPTRSVWLALGTSGALLAQLRSLGPMFLVISLVVIAGWRWPALREATSHARRAVFWTTGAVLLSLTTSVTWVITHHVKSLGDPPLEESASWGDAWSAAVHAAPGWIVQFIAAVPGRNIAPPPLVTAAWAVPLALLLLNTQWSALRVRPAILVLCSVVLGFPLLFTVLTFKELAVAWQSRYILPLAVGLPLLLALSGRTIRARLVINDIVLVAGVMTAEVVVARFAQNWYATTSPLIRTDLFPVANGWVPIFLLAVGVGLASAALLALANGEGQETPEATGDAEAVTAPSLPSKQAPAATSITLGDRSAAR